MEHLRYQTVHRAVVEVLPEFRPVLEEHLIDNEGEVLQHVLFWDLARFVLSAHQRSDHDVVARSLDFLERAAQSEDSRVVNLVAVSFVESVGPWDPDVSAFIAAWPPHLQEMAREQGWKADTLRSALARFVARSRLGRRHE